MPDDSPRWQWDVKSKRYRDSKNGRFLPARRVHVLRDRYTDFRVDQMRDFVASTLDGVDRTDRNAWRAAVRRTETLGWKRIENTLITEYVYGRGGIHAMTEADTAKLRNLLRGQKRYWNGFMQEAYDDPEKMTTAYMQNRSSLYHKAGTGFHERGRAGAWGVALPVYPGDHECMSACHCRWVLSEHGDDVHAVWQLGSSDHCPGCQDAAATYNPYIIERVQETGVYT